VKARAQLDKITLPFYSVGNWQGWNHHLRGNIEAFWRAPSPNKKLRVHIGGHTFAFYEDEGKMDMLRWYDHWLKGINTGIMDEPPVKLCVRTSARECKWRFENEWPLGRTQYTKYYLNPQPSGGVVQGSLNDARLTATAPAAPGRLTYDAGPAADGRGARGVPSASFVTEPLTQDVEITVTEDVLTIKGQAKQMEEEKGKNYYRRELRYGAFSRSLALPGGVQGDQAKASYRNGILEIRVPKSEKAKPKTVKVDVG